MSTPAEPAQAAPISEPSPAPEAPVIPQAQAAGVEAPAAPATPDGEQPPQPGTVSNNGTGTNVNDLLQSTSMRDLSAALRNPDSLQTEPTPGAQTEAIPPGTDPPAPAPQGEQPAPAAPEPPAAGDDKRPDRIRIGTFAQSDQDFLLTATQMSRSENITVREATQRLLAQQQQAQAAAPAPQPQTPPAEPVPDPLEAQRAKVEDLKAQLREANSAFDTDKAAELQIALAEEVAETKIMESQQAQAAKTLEASAATSWKAAEESAFAAMETDYPEFQKQGSALNTAVTEKIAELEKSDPAFFNKPDWVRYVVRDVAGDLGITPTRHAAAPQAPVAPQPPTARPAATAPRQPGHPAAIPPAPGGAGAGQPTGGEDIAALASSSDLKTLMGALRANGTRTQ